MQRFPDWARRLEGYLAENAQREFKLGQWDCITFVLGAIAVMTGRRMKEIPVSQARRGDVVLVKRRCLGLVAMDGKNVMVIGEDGLEAVPLQGLRAWHV